MNKIIDAILDFILPYKVIGVYYFGKVVSATVAETNGTIRGHEEPYGERVYWKERFFSIKNAQRFIKIGRSKECIFSGGSYLKLLRTENNGKTFIVWDNGLD